jgi:uncharacterized membrane protein YcfT
MSSELVSAGGGVLQALTMSDASSKKNRGFIYSGDFLKKIRSKNNELLTQWSHKNVTSGWMLKPWIDDIVVNRTKRIGEAE